MDDQRVEGRRRKEGQGVEERWEEEWKEERKEESEKEDGE